MQSGSHKDILPDACTPFSPEELEGSIVARFRHVVSLHRNCVAIKDQATTLSYGQLEERSNAMAQALLAILAGGPQPVAMMYKAGVSYNIAQLAVLATGNFYSNIDVELQQERQVLILKDLRSTIVLCDAGCFDKATALARNFPGLTVINTESLTLPAAAKAPVILVSPSDLAFIVYTSGSTGAPQGVMLTHRNILADARCYGKEYCLSSDDRATQICPLWTAASGSEIFSTLLNGATLLPFPIKDRGIFDYLKLLDAEAVTTFVATPALFRLIFSAAETDRVFRSVRLARLGGDRTTRADVVLFKQHFAGHCLLRVGYGSSEYMPVTQFFIDKNHEISGEVAPVGYPLDDCEVLLLDDDGCEVAQGEYGEIAARSKYLCSGYWNNPELTRQRFLPDKTDVSKRIYLTRDIGYQDAQGCLHHVGRKDSQVKIYGKMVLMSDVEQALLQIDGVKEAVVMPFDSGTRGTELAAFVVTDAGSLDAALIKSLLSKKLAPELVPRKISLLATMPMHINNKINRLALKDMAKKS